MIQRRQTVFMLLTAILSGLLFFMPLASISEAPVKFTIWGWNTITNSQSYTWILVVLVALMTLLPVYTLLIYKKRELQVKLCRLEMLLNIVFVGLVFLFYDNNALAAMQAVEYEGDTVTLSGSVGMILPCVNLLLEYFAIRGVKKDIELIKSIDRLR